MMTQSAPLSRQIALLAIVATAVLFATPSPAGSLNPPGPPASTMKPLTWVEGRIPVEILPGSTDALYVISQPGSYYLTANLVGVAGKGGILIDSDDVTLDLNGFALQGTTGGSGIFSSIPRRYITVKNGTLRGWGMHGVGLLDCTGCRAEDLLVDNTGDDGTYSSIFLGFNSQVRRCGVRENSNWIGIQVGSGSLVENCNSSNNWAGYELSGEFNMILRSLAVNNADRGIYMQGVGTVAECVVQGSGGSGIQVAQDAFVTRNTAWANGAGIGSEWSSNLIEDNFAHGSYFRGIVLGGGSDGSVVRRNQVTETWIGIDTSEAGMNLVISNSSSGNSTPFLLNDVYGIILDYSGGVTITDPYPWGNIIH